MAELGQKEGAHAGARDLVAVEDDAAALLDVHRVAQGAQSVATDVHVFAADEVEGAFAWAGAVRGVEGEVGVEELGDELGLRSGRGLEADRLTQRLIGDADVGRGALDDEILAAADEVGGQGVPEEAQGIIAAVGFESFADFGNRQRLLIIEEHAIVPGGHLDIVSDQVVTEVFGRMGMLGCAVFFRPDRDLPEEAVIPHVFAGAFQAAVRDADILRVGQDFLLRAFLLGPEDRDGRSGQTVGLDLLEAQVLSMSAGRSRDQDAPGVYVGLPGVVGARLVEYATHEATAPPGQVTDILSLEDHRTGFVAHVFRQSEGRPFGDDCQVGLQRDRHFAVQRVVARRDDERIAWLGGLEGASQRSFVISRADAADEQSAKQSETGEKVGFHHVRSAD